MKDSDGWSDLPSDEPLSFGPDEDAEWNCEWIQNPIARSVRNRAITERRSGSNLARNEGTTDYSHTEIPFLPVRLGKTEGEEGEAWEEALSTWLVGRVKQHICPWPGIHVSGECGILLAHLHKYTTTACIRSVKSKAGNKAHLGGTCGKPHGHLLTAEEICTMRGTWQNCLKGRHS